MMFHLELFDINIVFGNKSQKYQLGYLIIIII